MNTKMLTKVRTMYGNREASRQTNRHNQRSWVRSVRHLGDKWLLAVPVDKKEPQDESRVLHWIDVPLSA